MTKALNKKLKEQGMSIVDTINDINNDMNYAFQYLDTCPEDQEDTVDSLWDKITELRSLLQIEECKLEVINNSIDWSL